MENKQLIITKLHMKIELIRKRMIILAQQKGIHHSETVKLSQELDTHLNTYQKLI